MNLSIVGGGSWGTALAIVLAPRFERIRQWVYEPELAAQMAQTRENAAYLPGFRLPDCVGPSADLPWTLEGAHIVLGVMPSQHARGIYSAMARHLPPSAIVVSATKGIEKGSLLRISEVICQVLTPHFEPQIAVLSGPTFAREIARGEPAAVVVASHDAAAARTVQTAFSGPTFRLYTNSDPAGVELGAALKNIVAIAAGVCQGLGLGSNTQAALIARGLAEITRLAIAVGGQPQTLSGLAGLGDLVLTCSGDLSRNRKVGLELARGRPLPEIVGSMNMIAEGIETCDAAVALGRKFHVDLPIIEQMHAVLHASQSPQAAVRQLMERSLKSE
ncbi:MAG TPA: NAD(P)H-dependent glycerol-3-phosphate dehydrogenase [Bryobacteraceae bacterium]|nr:NAD(P)H-dependent glycerol-3-phosphate dehydrogenase [Bryobacteraceae bacterium]